MEVPESNGGGGIMEIVMEEWWRRQSESEDRLSTLERELTQATREVRELWHLLRECEARGKQEGSTVSHLKREVEGLSEIVFRLDQRSSVTEASNCRLEAKVDFLKDNIAKTSTDTHQAVGKLLAAFTKKVMSPAAKVPPEQWWVGTAKTTTNYNVVNEGATPKDSPATNHNVVNEGITLKDSSATNHNVVNEDVTSEPTTNCTALSEGITTEDNPTTTPSPIIEGMISEVSPTTTYSPINEENTSKDKPITNCTPINEPATSKDELITHHDSPITDDTSTLKPCQEGTTQESNDKHTRNDTSNDTTTTPETTTTTPPQSTLPSTPKNDSCDNDFLSRENDASRTTSIDAEPTPTTTTKTTTNTPETTPVNDDCFNEFSSKMEYGDVRSMKEGMKEGKSEKEEEEEEEDNRSEKKDNEKGKKDSVKGKKDNTRGKKDNTNGKKDSGSFSKVTPYGALRDMSVSKVTDESQSPEKVIREPQVPEKVTHEPQLPEKVTHEPQVPKKVTDTPQLPEKVPHEPQVPEKVTDTPQLPEKVPHGPQVPEKVTDKTHVPEKVANEAEKVAGERGKKVVETQSARGARSKGGRGRRPRGRGKRDEKEEGGKETGAVGVKEEDEEEKEEGGGGRHGGKYRKRRKEERRGEEREKQEEKIKKEEEKMKKEEGKMKKEEEKMKKEEGKMKKEEEMRKEEEKMSKKEEEVRKEVNLRKEEKNMRKEEENMRNEEEKMKEFEEIRKRKEEEEKRKKEEEEAAKIRKIKEEKNEEKVRKKEDQKMKKEEKRKQEEEEKDKKRKEEEAVARTKEEEEAKKETEEEEKKEEVKEEKLIESEEKEGMNITEEKEEEEEEDKDESQMKRSKCKERMEEEEERKRKTWDYLPELRRRGFSMESSGDDGQEAEVGMCANCGFLAKLRCANCRQAFYCKRECQREHWKKGHKDQCQPFQVLHSPELGRYMVASRDLKAGDVILREDPIAVGPKQVTEPVCLGCYRRVDGSYRCERCGWPMCGPDCCSVADHQPECVVGQEIGSPIEITNFDETNHFYEVIFPMRLLALKKRSPRRYEQLMSLESHYEDRVGTHLYEMNQKRIVNFLRNYFFLQEFSDSEIDSSESTIHTVTGITDVNALEIRLPETEILGLYPTFAMLEHSCTPNTRHSFTTERRVVLRAAVDIRRGEHLSTMYTHILWGTAARRDHLKHSKYFMCTCCRCSDPTELGTNFSALRCRNCSSGFLLSAAPLDELADWICASCSATLSSEEVTEANLRLGEEVEAALANPQLTTLEDIVTRHARSTVHPNHFHLFAARHTLLQMYGREPTAAGPEHMRKKERLCQDFLKVCTALDPGMARLGPYAGVALYEYHLAVLARARGDPDAPQKESAALKKDIDTAKALLQQCIRVLQDEPLDQPEGKLCAMAKDNLTELKQWEASITAP